MTEGHSTSSLPYVELHCHSYFSFCDGASSPEALLDRAAELGMPALALTDHDNLCGAVRFWQAARQRDIRPILGAEVTVVVESLQHQGHLTLLCTDQAGYSNLSRLLTRAHLGTEVQPWCQDADPHTWPGKAQSLLPLEQLLENTAGLLCLTGCRQGLLPLLMQDGRYSEALALLHRLQDTLGRENVYVELQHHLDDYADERIRRLLALARRAEAPVVATNLPDGEAGNVHYAAPNAAPLHDVLTCVRHRTPLRRARAKGLLAPTAERYLKSPAQMAALFEEVPAALTNTAAIAGRCAGAVSLDLSGQRLPPFPVPEGHTPFSYLYELCYAGLRRRKGLDEKINPVTPAASKQLAHELDVIERCGLAGYFLVVWDIVRFARERGIRCQGRGSAAGSLVAYLLDISPINPLEHDLLFERFLTPDRATAPDIDIDFAHDRREEVIQYIYQRYGIKHTAMACNVVTYRWRSAVRDVGKVLELPEDLIAQEAGSAWKMSVGEPPRLPASQSVEASSIGDDAENKRKEAKTQGRKGNRQTHIAGSAYRRGDGDETQSPTDLPGGSDDPHSPVALLRGLAKQLVGAPRHLSIHVGGMVITARPIAELAPLERATMPGRYVTQWDKESLEDAGLIKIDILSLRTLGMVEEALRYIADPLDLERLPLDDPELYAMLRRADTIGCFQVESRAQQQMLPRLQPQRFEDIVISVAIVRPGPITSGMVHPYLRRRAGEEPVTYADPSLEPVLRDTLGVILFQEQAIRVAVQAAGFSPGQAERLRRAISSTSVRGMETLLRLQEEFVAGAQSQGLRPEAIVMVWEQLCSFAGFGFCRSHAAAFALVAYQTLWLKRYHPVAFYVALLNSQPMGFYSPEVILGDAKRHGISVLPPDVNESGEQCQPAGSSRLRLGLRYIESWKQRACGALLAARREGSFADLADLCRCTRLPRALIQNAIRAGACDEFGARRQLLWQLGRLDYQAAEGILDEEESAVSLPHLQVEGEIEWEYELLGLSTQAQVMASWRPALNAAGVLSTAQVRRRPNHSPVQVAGLLVTRQRPESAQGFVFLTLEDEYGLVDVIVSPDLYQRCHTLLHNSPFLQVRGVLQRAQGTLNVRAVALEPLLCRSWQRDGVISAS